MPKNLSTAVAQSFEDIKQTNEHGAEYWSARDLQNLLGYSQWRRFEDAIKRAITSCKESGNEPSNYFADAGKMVGLGFSGTPSEHIPPAEHIKEVEKRVKQSTPKMELDQRNAGGLLGGGTNSDHE
jgi:hypothetical protein